ncbi:MAG: glutathione S-transferase family protein [Sphingorhabdus sp.]
MKLYQTYLSPFPTRVRLMIYLKGLDVEIIEPTGIHGASEGKGDYTGVNPIGRVPCLVLDDGRALAESEVICEYLEEAFPDPPTLPADPWERARVRVLSRISDIYVVMAMVPLFNNVALPENERDAAVIEKAGAEVQTALGYLEDYLVEGEFCAVGNSMTHADGTLIPILMLASIWAPLQFGFANPLESLPKLSAYWSSVQKQSLAQRLIKETKDALEAAQSAREG